MDRRIIRNLEVPTGNILIFRGSKGKLECLSLGDYGQAVNLNQHKKVEHGPLLPLTEKWVITVSTQYGCSMGCKFCDVPKVGPGVNATSQDICGQVLAAMSIHPEVERTKRLNVHYARMGEPTWNENVIHSAYALWNVIHKDYILHPVVSTMMPRNNFSLSEFIREWIEFKNIFMDGEAGLQISVNSTNEREREEMFNGNAMSLQEIGMFFGAFPAPVGRKYTLNFAVADYSIDPKVLLKYFSPENFVVKLTPMHKTDSALKNGIRTIGDYTDSYPYEHHERALKEAGYNVLTFIASSEEDLGRITCGNAILSGATPLTDYRIVPFEEAQ